jgi:four helix bundle protein
MYKFQTLIVWQKGKELTKQTLDLTEEFPSKYKYTLIQQLVRSTLSITNNIAEGSGRITWKDKRYFYVIAYGSLLETVNMLLLIKDFRIIKSEKIQGLLSLTEEISKMLHSLIKKKYDCTNN